MGWISGRLCRWGIDTLGLCSRLRFDSNVNIVGSWVRVLNTRFLFDRILLLGVVKNLSLCG